MSISASRLLGGSSTVGSYLSSAMTGDLLLTASCLISLGEREIATCDAVLNKQPNDANNANSRLSEGYITSAGAIINRLRVDASYMGDINSGGLSTSHYPLANVDLLEVRLRELQGRLNHFA